MNFSIKIFDTTAEDLIKFLNNEDEESLKRVKKEMEECGIEYLETVEGLCVFIDESPTHIGLYFDGSGSGFGGVPKYFKKKNPDSSEDIKQVQTAKIITVDFKNKKVISRK